ncbi:hypothetical protein [Sphaerimonospora thailandensis]|uniref:Uncharacterized protein n=1 Tax=Sphaerimonospora thailandensis TaxID=795644 RepID=A0A8J3RAD6_9ACTN|nr:hypothetical protein [Sphaerimonospora thailandensis]GIH68953.1 hypothetical protein Mth01_12060 [Sphaerimonospora thailandensis]
MADGSDDSQDRRGGRAKSSNQEWLLAVLPAFPLVLLVLRLWYAGRQDTQTLLLLVQHVSPLGLLSSVLIPGLWIIPAVVLLIRVLSALYVVSARRSSLLVRAADRIPDWVLVVAVAVALLAWQLRFLPTLLMLTLAVLGLTVRERGHRRSAVRFVGAVLPLLAAVVCYVLLAPAIADAMHEGDRVTLLLLAMPPGLSALLTGPVPRAFAWVISHGVALLVALVLPVVVGVVFLRVPVMPLVAVETTGEDGLPPVIVGYTITVDDRMTTFLSTDGIVRFVDNDHLGVQTLCPDPAEIPNSRVDLRGWYVEESMISWLAPERATTPDDPRCQGRRAG